MSSSSRALLTSLLLGCSLALADPLDNFQARASFNQVPLLLLLLQVVGIAFYYVLLVASLLAERRAEETAVLRSRGAGVTQIVLLAAAEASCLAVVSALDLRLISWPCARL